MKPLLFLCVIMLVGCGPAWQLRRAEKLKKLAIAEGAIVKTDTIFKDRMVKIKGDSTTVIVHHYGTILKDTTIYQDKIKIQYQLHHDTLWEKIQCPDSIIRWRERTAVNEQIICPPPNNFWKYVALTLGVIVVIGMGFLFLKLR